MKTISAKIPIMFFTMFIILLFPGSALYSQEVMLDRMEKYGDLICYPEMDDPNNFYYLPDQPRIASKDGKPQFSFLKYAKTQETGKAGTGEAGGGGLVHFLVTYGVSEGRIKNAENALQERHPDAKIAGPIIYRKGSFALITSFKEGNELFTKVVAVGKAPLMEGQKTAVSMALTREGAELLWASFQTDTPDISLVFDMEFAGIREPYEATLEADWSSIAKSDRIQAGFKYKWFGADVDMLFQELRQTGAIKITTKGENASMERILESANEKLLKVMFEPVAADDLTRAAADSSYDSLNQAAKMLKDASTSGSTSTVAGKTTGIYRNRNIYNTAANPFLTFLDNVLSPAAYADPKESAVESQETVKGNAEQAQAESASDAYAVARRIHDEVRQGGFQIEAIKNAISAYEEYKNSHNPSGSRLEEVEGYIRMLKERLKEKEASQSGSTGADKNIVDDSMIKGSESQKSADSGQPQVEGSKTGTADTGLKAIDLKDLPPLPMPSSDTKTQTPASGTTSTNAPTTATNAPTKAATSTTPKPATTSQKARSDGSPGFSLVASYKMKKIKRSGKMVYNMNNFRTETQAFAMAENIGHLFRLYGRDQGVFRAITIDDPVFKQREIKVTLDGQDASTFTKYLNFVTIKLKKVHQNGETTTGEVVVTPENFNTSGNNFSVVYGWKDDTDRTKWLDYEYQVTWSFYGGNEIRTPWTKTDSPMLALIPPHHYRSITIEGNGKSLTDAEVRHGVLTFKCRVGDKNISQQVTIRNNGPAPSIMVDIPEDIVNPETKVDITWHLANNRKLSAKSALLEGDIIYWDELPKGGI
ncbi:MAG: hypothetical protein JW927_19190 [Deltaproteobacteria bacterium]|nr:hypothetical protein [Deltaproteobacteria bacterium]